VGTGWFSVITRAGTPRTTVTRLNRILTDYIQRPDVQDKFTTLAIAPRTSTPDELERLIGTEITKWAQVVKDAGITPE